MEPPSNKDPHSVSPITILVLLHRLLYLPRPSCVPHTLESIFVQKGDLNFGMILHLHSCCQLQDNSVSLDTFKCFMVPGAPQMPSSSAELPDLQGHLEPVSALLL